MSDELWVMSDEWWKLSDGNWVIKFCYPNRLYVSKLMNWHPKEKLVIQETLKKKKVSHKRKKKKRLQIDYANFMKAPLKLFKEKWYKKYFRTL